MSYSYIKKPEEGGWDEGHGASLQNYSKREVYGKWNFPQIHFCVFVMRNLVVGGKWQSVSVESILVIISASKYQSVKSKELKLSY